MEGLIGYSVIVYQFRLTQTSGREHSGGHVRRKAIRKDGLQDVAGEGERNDGQRGGIHDEYGAPQKEEPGGEGECQSGLFQVETCLPAQTSPTSPGSSAFSPPFTASS